MRRLNWPIWLSLLISIFAFLSYPFIFVNWATTRDFPWANFVLFAIADVLLIIGILRAFRPNRKTKSRVAGIVVATLSTFLLGFFIFGAFVESRWLPASAAAPQVSQRAPDFTLTDTNNQQVSLSGLLSQNIVADSSRTARGVLLIFYRG